MAGMASSTCLATCSSTEVRAAAAALRCKTWCIKWAKMAMTWRMGSSAASPPAAGWSGITSTTPFMRQQTPLLASAAHSLPQPGIAVPSACATLVFPAPSKAWSHAASKELALAFGLNLGLARVGSALGMSISPRIAESFSFNSALWLGAVVMISGLILFMVYMTMDYRDARRRGALGEDGASKLAANRRCRVASAFLRSPRGCVSFAAPGTELPTLAYPHIDARALRCCRRVSTCLRSPRKCARFAALQWCFRFLAEPARMCKLCWWS